MSQRFLVVLGCAGLLASLCAAQNLQRRANITGGGDRDRGKCTIEVVVDGAADIEIRGGSAFLRNQSGQRPQWRRFDCTSQMPDYPADVRFKGVDGRGRQQLIQVPQGGGGAVIVRIEDTEGGTEGYTFDITWALQPGGYYADNPGITGNRQFPDNDAVQACQQAIRQQAASRFGGANVTFRTASIDNQPGRHDWVIGTVDIYDRGVPQGYRFSCQIDFGSGQVRSAEIETGQGGQYGYRGQGDRRQYRSSEEQACEKAVSDRLWRDRYSNIDIEFHPSRQDRANRITGSVRANLDGRVSVLNFSCIIDRNSRTVRSVKLKNQQQP